LLFMHALDTDFHAAPRKNNHLDDAIRGGYGRSQKLASVTLRKYELT
jgi:hypothetical protein